VTWSGKESIILCWWPVLAVVAFACLLLGHVSSGERTEGLVPGVFLFFFSLAPYRQRLGVRFSYTEKKGECLVIGGTGSSGGARDYGLAHLRLSWWRETLHREIERFARSSRGGGRARLGAVEERQGVGTVRGFPAKASAPFTGRGRKLERRKISARRLCAATPAQRVRSFPQGWQSA
jgi:hypothetical protein